MKLLYNTNGLVIWDEHEIALRDRFIAEFSKAVSGILRDINRAWLFRRVEAPILTPANLINPNYTADDLWTADDLVLRPETTMGSYVAAQKMLEEKGSLLPLCVWQAGKSFRKEQDKSLSNMRLKEFWQLEFQCLYAANSKADYQQLVMQPLADILQQATQHKTRVIPSDRLPSYSLKTDDIEAILPDGRFMELASVSVRRDYSEEIKVLEIAIGLDRCVYLGAKDKP